MLTVTEKEHRKGRIARRIDKRIEAMTASDSNSFRRTERHARQRVLESLGLAEHQAELDRIERQKEDLERREKQLRKAMLAPSPWRPAGGCRGLPLLPAGLRGGQRHQQAQRCPRRGTAGRKRTGPAGPQTPSAEKDEVLDVFRLATSGTQIRRLWQKVAELLGNQPTQLQRDALAIDSADQ